MPQKPEPHLPMLLERFWPNNPIAREHINIFKAGLACATRVVAVSHGCALMCCCGAD